MDREAALASLPAAYAQALRLRDRGLTSAEIARCLEIPPEAVSSTLALARAKLERRLVSVAADGISVPATEDVGRSGT